MCYQEMTPNDDRSRSLCRYATWNVIKNGRRMIFNTFYVIGKKNNQTSVSNADREIPTLGSMDNAGNFVSGIIRLLSGWNFSVCFRGRWKILRMYSVFASRFMNCYHFLYIALILAGYKVSGCWLSAYFVYIDTMFYLFWKYSHAQAFSVHWNIFFYNI